MCGPAFAGKSTLARKIVERTGSKLVSFDTTWVEEDKKIPVPEGAEGWEHIQNKTQEKVRRLLKEGYSVVYDDNSPRKENREPFIKIAKEIGVESVVVYLDTPLNVILEREKKNKVTQDRHEVETHNFEKVLKDMEPPTSDENAVTFTPDMNIDEFIGKLE
jgi:predicted kinase